jgi:hypothetical protein
MISKESRHYLTEEAADNAIRNTRALSHTPEEERLPPEAGAFPIEAFPAVLREYAEDLARVFCAPSELPALCTLGAVSGAIGGKWKLSGAVNGHETPGALYIALSLQSGSGKSIANRIIRPIADFEGERCKKWKEDERPKLEAELDFLQKEQRKTNELSLEERGKLCSKIRKLEERLRFNPSLIGGNSTTSGLARQLSETQDETLFIFSADGGDILRVMLGAYTKGADTGDFDLFLNAYSGESYHQTRAPKPGSRGADILSLKAPSLSLLILAQPCIVRELVASDEARNRGLLPRILAIPLIVPLTEDDGHERKPEGALESAYQGRITELLRYRTALATPAPIQCDTGAREVFRAFHNESVRLTNGAFGDLRSDLARWREQALRIAVCFALAENPQTLRLTEQTAKAAVAVARWVLLKKLELLSQGRVARIRARADHLEERLAEAGGEKTIRELRDSNGLAEEEIRQLVAQFPGRFRLECRKSSGGGRPAHYLLLGKS